jgi:hypothetical protein
MDVSGSKPMMDSVVHTPSAIEYVLRLGLTPITDNADALATLGFKPAYPQIKSGYESTIWERSIERGRLNHDGRRLLVRERALFVKAPTRRAGRPRR